MDRLGGEHKRGAVLHWLTHFGRGVGRVVIAVLAFILGLLPDVHAIGPSRSCADDVVVPAFIDVVGPSSHVFLAAYRANGPPNSIVILISAATAVEDRSGSSRRYFIAFVCKSGRSARREDGLYGAYFVPNATDPEGKFWWMIGGALIGAGLDAIDQWANIAMGSQQGWDWSRTFINAGIRALAGGLFKYGGMWGKALVTSFGGVATALGGIETYNRWQTYGPNDPRTLVSAAQTMLGLAGTYYGEMYPRVNYSLTTFAALRKLKGGFVRTAIGPDPTRHLDRRGIPKQFLADPDDAALNSHHTTVSSCARCVTPTPPIFLSVRHSRCADHALLVHAQSPKREGAGFRRARQSLLVPA